MTRTNPIAPPIFPDTTGCCHVPVRCMGVWNCKLRPMEMVDTEDGERLRCAMSKQPPSETEAQAVFDELDSWLGRRGSES